MKTTLTAAALLLCLGPTLLLGQSTQPAVRFLEPFAPGYQYHVRCRVQINGSLIVPGEKGQSKELAVVGSSVIDYDERVLTEKGGLVDKTIRVYRKMEFQRKVGDDQQQTALRPEVRRLVLLRHKQFEVPFSPAGPLLWGEIDLVRTDVFTPALVGLFPVQAVKPGERWQAAATAIQELTDLERLEEGQLTCTLENISTLVGRQQARVQFQGTVKGIGEDGPARHQLEGHFYFDLTSNHLSYLYVKGTHFLLDKAGQPMGKVEGSFVLTREPVQNARDLTDADLKGLTLDPNDDNTQLLFDQPELGLRFLYPRRWRLGSVTPKQIALDEQKGSGLLITLEPLAKMPTAAQYLQEVQTWLKGQKATVNTAAPIKTIAPGIDYFGLDVELNKQRQILLYYVVRQPQGGATVTARVLFQDWNLLRDDVDRVVKSMRFGK